MERSRKNWNRKRVNLEVSGGIEGERGDARDAAVCGGTETERWVLRGLGSAGRAGGIGIVGCGRHPGPGGGGCV